MSYLLLGSPHPEWPSRENSQHSHCPCNPEELLSYLVMPDYESTDCPLELSEFQLSPPFQPLPIHLSLFDMALAVFVRVTGPTA